MTRRPATFVPALLLTVVLGALTACGSDSSSDESSDGSSSSIGSSASEDGSPPDDGSEAGVPEFCDAVVGDRATSAVVFNPVIPGVSTGGTASIENRLAFLDGTAPPEGLEAEWDAFRAHLEGLDPEVYSIPGDEVDQAREALFEASMACS